MNKLATIKTTNTNDAAIYNVIDSSFMYTELIFSSTRSLLMVPDGWKHSKVSIYEYKTVASFRFNKRNSKKTRSISEKHEKTYGCNINQFAINNQIV